jgi:beta-aspartyl-peptidase (threonine type)
LKLCVAWPLALPCGCISSGLTVRDRQEIQAVLDVQAEAWNRGDIERFMEPYWHSPDLTFCSGGKVTRGWNETLNRYKTRYPTRDDMGRLHFSDLELIPVASRATLVLGRWALQREKPVGGNFSLVMRKQAGRWVIIHDHTSTDSP